MTRARQILPGTTYLISRRCLLRQYLLRPGKKLNAIIRYCLAVCAERYGIHLHAFGFLSNHLHLVLTDPNACLPRFMQDLGQLLARSINALRGRRETFWAPGSYNDVRLATPQAVLGEMVYTVTNPVSSWLVSKSYQWPGVISRPDDIGTTTVVERPDHFFRANGSMPEQAVLRLTQPPAFADVSLERFRDDFAEAVRQREAQLKEQARQEGRSFLGRKAVLKQRPTDSPKTHEPRRRLRPRVAARDPRVLAVELAKLRQFEEAYAAARKAHAAGKRDVVFPPGTYWMRVHMNVVCAAPD